MLSKRELARRVGVSHVAIITGRISPETNAKVLAVIDAEQARGERDAFVKRIGEVAIGVLASEGADCERHEYLLRVGEAACRVLASEAK